MSAAILLCGNKLTLTMVHYQKISLNSLTKKEFSAYNILKYFSYFFQKIGFCHLMQIVSLGDNLHEITKPIFWEK